MNPAFSVVIPLYNKQEHIGKTVQSVLEQTITNYQIIVVNDGSTDNSIQVLNSFKDDRLIIYSKTNGGVSSARNLGIEKAKYKYITFLDADDWWEPTFLEEMSKLINKYPNCGFYASAYKIIERNKPLLVGHQLQEGVVENFFKLKVQYSIPMASAVVVCKDVFSIVGGFPEGMIGGEDDYTWSKIAVKYNMAITPKILASYNKEFSSIGSRFDKVDSINETWFDLYEEGNYYKNEYIAFKGITNGIRHAYGFHRSKSLKMEKLFSYTSIYRGKWKYLFFLNRMPNFGIKLLGKIKLIKMKYS